MRQRERLAGTSGLLLGSAMRDKKRGIGFPFLHVPKLLAFNLSVKQRTGGRTTVAGHVPVYPRAEGMRVRCSAAVGQRGKRVVPRPAPHRIVRMPQKTGVVLCKWGLFCAGSISSFSPLFSAGHDLAACGNKIYRCCGGRRRTGLLNSQRTRERPPPGFATRSLPAPFRRSPGAFSLWPTYVYS